MLLLCGELHYQINIIWLSYGYPGLPLNRSDQVRNIDWMDVAGYFILNILSNPPFNSVIIKQKIQL